MAAKRTKGKATKKSGRKQTTRVAAPKRKVTAARKKPRKAAAKKAAPAKSAVTKLAESSGMLNLLRAWSPSRYSGH